MNNQDALNAVLEANVGGRLYPAPDAERRAVFDQLVREGWLLPVSATRASLRGYVALLPGASGAAA